MVSANELTEQVLTFQLSILYPSLEACLIDLEKRGELLRIKEEIDPYLEAATIHLKVHAAGGPAILFEKIKDSKFRAVSNIFGTKERSEFIFRDTLPAIKKLVDLKNDPLSVLKNPVKNISILFAALKSRPLQNPVVKPIFFEEIRLSEIPQIIHWPGDGGAFITLPQVYTEDPDLPGITHANTGMYRIQISGNDYLPDKEAGLHYQLHRGIGIHQTKALKKGEPLKVSIFVGGPPAHSVAAVMPLPEGLSESAFAGALAGRRFRYLYRDGFAISTEADFVITGFVHPDENKPEGPFGDHLGYYSLKHNFPVLRIHKCWAKKNAIWPFTVVGRPPQEDTSFGALIHSISGKALEKEIPGLKEINAVDAAGVHPLLLAIGSERYTPYSDNRSPAEILTIANRILGTGQLSLAKFLFITTTENEIISTKDIPQYFKHFLERVNFERDIHFYTKTTIDTLDYSGTSINSGSKAVIAAAGDAIRTLGIHVPRSLQRYSPQLIIPGAVAIQTSAFVDYASAEKELKELENSISASLTELNEFPLIVLCDDSNFVSKSLNNFLWVTFTRANPANDIYGTGSFTEHKHWGCKSLIIDARAKPHHAPGLTLDGVAEKRADEILSNYKF